MNLALFSPACMILQLVRICNSVQASFFYGDFREYIEINSIALIIVLSQLVNWNNKKLGEELDLQHVKNCIQ